MKDYTKKQKILIVLGLTLFILKYQVLLMQP